MNQDCKEKTTKYYRLSENYGLQITFDVNPQDYGGSLAQEYGVRVSVHTPKEYSYPQVDGFTIAPGEITEVNIRRRLQLRLKAPYSSSCYDRYPDSFYAEKLILSDEYRYSLTECKMACVDYYLKTLCGCVDNRLVSLKASINAKELIQFKPRIWSSSMLHFKHRTDLVQN